MGSTTLDHLSVEKEHSVTKTLFIQDFPEISATISS